MSGWFESLMNRGAMPALTATMSFTHARHRVIAENVANMSTPGYKAKHLDYGQFQQALGEALERRGDDPRKNLEFKGSGQFSTDAAGNLQVTPVEKPGENVLFHDGTNMSIEQEMSDLAANGMLHEMTTQLLRQQYEDLREAIRGRV